MSRLRQKASASGTDVEQQADLLTEMVNNGQNRQAFDYVVERALRFRSSLQWQRISQLALEKYMESNQESGGVREKLGNYLILVNYYRQIVLTVATAPIHNIKILIQKYV